MERTFKVRNFWTMLEMESQEASEDSQNKENKQAHAITVGFLCKRSKINMSFKILVEAKSLCVVINPLLTGPVWSRWLYIKFVLHLRLHGPRLRLAKNRTRPVPSHLDLTVGQ